MDNKEKFSSASNLTTVKFYEKDSFSDILKNQSRIANDNKFTISRIIFNNNFPIIISTFKADKKTNKLLNSIIDDSFNKINRNHINPFTIYYKDENNNNSFVTNFFNDVVPFDD